MQLLMIVWPSLKEISEEGESGRKQISQYTRYLAVILINFSINLLWLFHLNPLLLMILIMFFLLYIVLLV